MVIATPTTAMPTKSAVALGTRRIANPTIRITRAARMVRASPNRRPHAGARMERRTNASSGTVVNRPAAVAPSARSLRISGITNATEMIAGRRFSPTKKIPSRAINMLGRAARWARPAGAPVGSVISRGSPSLVSGLVADSWFSPAPASSPKQLSQRLNRLNQEA